MRSTIPLIATLALGVFATSKPKISPSKVVDDIKRADLMGTLKVFDRIAQANGGNRAFGHPGFRASVDYILSQVGRHRHDVDFYEQEFETLYQRVDAISLNVLNEDPLFILGFTYSPSTPPEGLTGELVLGPAGEAGCYAGNYTGINARDNIVLVQRWKCPDNTTFAGRIRPAVTAGAKAVIVYHDLDDKPVGGTLTAPDPVGYRPSGLISKQDGEKLKVRIEGGEKVEVFFKHLQTIEPKKTWNVIVDTKTGDPNNVIVVGAHLDSVQAGPGVNDDGSGSSLILSLLNSVHKYDTNLKVRFAWWGAEENGLIGSRYYVANNKELKNIRAYLNFDMVSRGYYGVFDGDGSTHGTVGAPGSEVIEKLFTEYLTSQGITVTPAVFTGGSDYVAFMQTGIPVGGLHTGTGHDQDPCYHQACDTYDNANSTVITHNAKAAGYVLAHLARDGKKLIPKWGNNTGARLASPQDIIWGVEEGAGHLGCGHEDI